ncbi:MAG TPA: HD domain-containing protein [Candidatus Syntrophoarchaeum butanivorans]|uniref:HD domain-containing protein n=1 Tax=Candidatus Syntropharchaeum butanivorans TaxID=1839936 RepID=A0A7C1B8C2_9EURY|nr:MAG: HD domain-containing protein [Candidatus Syntrophoarchaeum sp. WYZ-LMO15]HDM35701.1 HD domain-containing protein [Candidatus Syntrophoarchaeum butanivorans]
MKTIRDPLHGSIELDNLALELLDTPQMQRLRRIRQLGFSNLVYPGANHTRFEHSLGVYHLAKRLLDLMEIEDPAFLVSSLIHDIGHAPFSHVTEEVIHRYLGYGHEKIDDIVKRGEIGEVLSRNSLSPGEVLGYIHGKPPLGRILANEIDIDKMDYILRDSYYTGAAFGLVDCERLIRVIRILNGEPVIELRGLQVAESLLVTRFLMYSAVYHHHVSRIAGSMFLKALSDLIERGEIDPARLSSMDECELTLMMRDAGGYARWIIESLNNRRLFKRAIYTGISSFERGKRILDLRGKERRIEEEIASRAGVDPAYVILDIPKIPEIPGQGAKILMENNEVKYLYEVSNIVRILSDAVWDKWRLGVYTRKEDLERVAKASREVLGIGKEIKQVVLDLYID